MGPLLVINGVIPPINGLTNGNWGYFTPISGVITVLITGRGPPCRIMGRTLTFCGAFESVEEFFRGNDTCQKQVYFGFICR